jgi:hypothetical protein
MRAATRVWDRDHVANTGLEPVGALSIARALALVLASLPGRSSAFGASANRIGTQIMRQFQISTFTLGVASLIAATFFIGKDMGDTLWKAAIAILLVDVVCIQLWPSAKRS